MIFSKMSMSAALETEGVNNCATIYRAPTSVRARKGTSPQEEIVSVRGVVTSFLNFQLLGSLTNQVKPSKDPVCFSFLVTFSLFSKNALCPGSRPFVGCLIWISSL